MEASNYYRLASLLETACIKSLRYIEYRIQLVEIDIHALLEISLHPLHHCYIPHLPCCCGYYSPRSRPSMTKKQWDTLYEPNSNGCHSYNGNHPCKFRPRSSLDLNDLDISILSLLIKKTLKPTDPADLQAISTIVDLRNMLAHARTLVIDDDTFEREWQKARFAIIHLAEKLPLPDYIKLSNDIEGLKTKSLDKGECERLLSAMKNIRETDGYLQDISNRLERIENKQNQMSSDITCVKDDVRDVKRKVGNQ